MEQSLSYQARRALLQQTVPQYREASPSQKRTLLDTFVAATSFNFSPVTDDSEGQVQLFAEKVVPAVRERLGAARSA